MTFGPNFGLSNFLPSEFQLPEEPDEFRAFIAQRERITADLINNRTSGNFDLLEFFNGEQWFTADNNQLKRSAFRLVFNRTTPIAAGGNDTFNHNITGMTTPTRIWGVATTATPDFRPIPYASVTNVNLQIQVSVTATQVVVTNGAAAPQIDSYILVLEYLKQ